MVKVAATSMTETLESVSDIATVVATQISAVCDSKTATRLHVESTPNPPRSLQPLSRKSG